MSSCCSERNNLNEIADLKGEYVCYCNHVSEKDIKNAILNHNCKTVKEVIEFTGAMKNSNCSVNNPKGSCCYSDIVFVFNKYYK